ncbi:unnamed protein product, partial [Brugia timori]|uniref:Uncharacterized protein n=1 Tax=Brugia timori TaxID=42155 RepID=A0A0R3R0U5_9BILA
MCSSLILLFLLFPSGNGCMAGYGYERMKLKEYLGIEWIEGGFDETDQHD